MGILIILIMGSPPNLPNFSKKIIHLPAVAKTATADGSGRCRPPFEAVKDFGSRIRQNAGGFCQIGPRSGERGYEEPLVFAWKTP